MSAIAAYISAHLAAKRMKEQNEHRPKNDKRHDWDSENEDCEDPEDVIWYGYLPINIMGFVLLSAIVFIIYMVLTT